METCLKKSFHLLSAFQTRIFFVSENAIFVWFALLLFLHRICCCPWLNWSTQVCSLEDQVRQVRTISMGVPLCGAHIWPQLCPGSRTWGVFKELNGFYIPTKLGIHRDHLSSSSGGLTNFNQRFKVHSDGCGINPRPRPFRWGWLKNPLFVVNSNGPTVSPNGQGCTVR